MRTILSLVAFLFLVGCSGSNVTPPGTVTVWIDPNLPENVQTAAREAVQDWQDATAGVWTYEITSDAAAKVFLFSHDDREGSLATTEGLGGDVIKIHSKAVEEYPNAPSRVWRLILRHEMGHALGAEHMEGTLMSTHYNGVDYRCIDQKTLQQVATFNGVDVGRFKETCQ